MKTEKRAKISEEVEGSGEKENKGEVKGRKERSVTE